MDEDLTQAAIARAPAQTPRVRVDQLDQQAIRLAGQMLREQILTTIDGCRLSASQRARGRPPGSLSPEIAAVKSFEGGTDLTGQSATPGS